VSRTRKIESVAALALVLASIILFLTAIEFTLRWSVPCLPLRFHKYLSDDIFVLAQRSKRAFLPRDYMAILGDSYLRVPATGTLRQCARTGAGASPTRPRT
jgi:hypothetical protein